MWINVTLNLNDTCKMMMISSSRLTLDVASLVASIPLGQATAIVWAQFQSADIIWAMAGLSLRNFGKAAIVWAQFQSADIIWAIAGLSLRNFGKAAIVWAQFQSADIIWAVAGLGNLGSALL